MDKEATKKYADSINAMSEDEARCLAPAPSMAWLQEIASKLEDGQYAHVSINDQDDWFPVQLVVENTTYRRYQVDRISSIFVAHIHPQYDLIIRQPRVPIDDAGHKFRPQPGSA